MTPDEEFEDRDFRQELSESDSKTLSDGLRAFARMINDQVEVVQVPSSVESDDTRVYMDNEEFWDTYGASFVRCYNYMKYGRWVPEDGLDVYVVGVVDTVDGLQASFVLSKSARRNPAAP